jgi:hypothetical protein
MRMSSGFWRIVSAGFAVVGLVCFAWRISLGITEDITSLQWALQVGLLASLGLALLADRKSRHRPNNGE